MPIGQEYTIKIHEDAVGGTVVFDSVHVKQFTHVAGATTATSVDKEDFKGSTNEAFVVKVAYPSTALPTQSSVTIAGLQATAIAAVNAIYGDGEAGPST